MEINAVRNAKRRGTICPICKKRKATQIHHIVHGSKWNRALSEKYSNACLIYICAKCHEQVHHTETADNKYDSLDWRLKAQAELDFKKYYPDDDWFNTFGRYYAWSLEEEQ